MANWINKKDSKKVKNKISSDEFMEIMEEGYDEVEISKSVIETNGFLSKMITLIRIAQYKQLPTVKIISRKGIEEIIE